MENAADALKMAAFVLIFVVMLTITISSFSEARRVSQTVLEYQDKTFDYDYVDDYKYESGKLTTERIVEAESIIPAVYRAFLENYKVYFLNSAGNGIELYKKHINGTDVSINYIDLQDDKIVSFGSDKQKEQFILAILYGTKYNKFASIKEYYSKNYRITLKDGGLCDIILTATEKKFEEKLGEYYQEDLQIENNGQIEDSGNATAETNKDKKRIITYKQCN